MADEARQVTVRLNAMVDGYIRDVRRAGHATDSAFSSMQGSARGANRELGVMQGRLQGIHQQGAAARTTLTQLNTRAGRLGGSLHTVNTELTNTNTRLIHLGGFGGGGIRGLAGQFDRGGQSIDRYSGRLRLLGEALAVLGPGLIPVVGALVPLLSSAATMGLAAATGIAATVVAFQGVGDAFDAIEKADLDPSVKNLQAMQLALQKLTPEAREFLNEVRSRGPLGQALKDAAATGLFPGLTQALEELDSRGPDAIRILHNMAEATGDLVADSAASLASERWDDFFDMVEHDGPAALDALGDVVGNLTHGLAELLLFTQPVGTTFTDGLVNATEKFDRFATRLDQTEGGREFLEYIEETGPEVLETLGAIGGAFVDIVQAAAPLGDEVLNGLEGIAEAISVIADSPLGTPLFAMAAGLSLLNRTIKVTQATAGRFGVGGTTGGTAASGGLFAPIIAGSQRASSGVRGFVRDVRLMNTQLAATRRAVPPSGFIGPLTSSQTAALGAARAAERVRGTVAAAAKGAAIAGGLALVTTGAAESMGLANTASLALLGTLGGPWGIAVGAATGAVLDLGEALDGTDEAITAFNQSAQTGDLDEMRHKLDDLRLATANLEADVSEDPISWLLKRDDLEDSKEALADAEAQVQQLKALQTVAVGLGAERGPERETFWSSLGADIMREGEIAVEDLDETVRRATPAMRAFGITFEDLGDMTPAELGDFIVDVKEFNRAAGSDKGKIDEFGKSVADLANDFLSTADSAAELATAMDSLFTPKFDLSAATDAWRKGLLELKDELKDLPKTLRGDRGLETREVIRGQAELLMNQLQALANAGASPERVARTLERGRSQLVKFGQAAGLGEKDLRRFLNTLGLTPELVETTLEVSGAAEAERRIRRIQGAMEKYGVTKREARALLKDLATGKLQSIIALQNQADRDISSTVTVTRFIQHKVTPNAMGGMYVNGVRTYAGGGMDVPNGHQAEYAGAGSTARVWLEPETQGESYVPHANDHRRPRAKKVLSKTAELFGGRVEWYADGGWSRAAAPNLQPVTGGRASTLVEFAPAVVEIRDPWGGTQTVEIIASAVARDEIDATQRFEHVRSGR